MELVPLRFDSLGYGIVTEVGSPVRFYRIDSGSRIATLTMVFKLAMEAQKHWSRLNGPKLVAKVVTGVKFVDGEEQIEQAA